MAKNNDKTEINEQQKPPTLPEVSKPSQLPQLPTAKDEGVGAVSKEVSEQKFELALRRIKRLIDIVRGKEDVRNRLSAILDPQKPQSSSNLTAVQVNFQIRARWFTQTYPKRYSAIGALADEMTSCNMSLNGWGVEKAISLTAAIEQSAVFKQAYGSTGEKKSILPSFRKQETKQ
jgi:hypothetical protein